MSKNVCKYLIQEFDINVLDLVKQKVYYPLKYMTNFKKFKEQLPSKETFDSSLTGKKINDEEYEHVLNVWNKLEMRTMKNYHDLSLKV